MTTGNNTDHEAVSGPLSTEREEESRDRPAREDLAALSRISSARPALMRAAVLLDQIVYSCAGFVTTILAARSLSLEDFGVFVLLYTAVVLAVGLQRASVAEPLMVVSGEGNASAHVARRSFLTSLSFGAVACAAVWFVGSTLLGGSALTGAVCGLGVVGPFLQDGLRYLLYVMRGSICMFVSDLISAGSQVGLLLLASNLVNSTYCEFILAWGVGSLGGPLVLGWLLVRSRFADDEDSLSRYKAMRRPFGVDYLLGIVSLQSTLYVTTAMAGVGGAAALRGVDALVGPARIALQSLPAVLLRKWSASGGARSRQLLLVLALISVGTFACAYLAACLPDHIGRGLMGASWSAVAPVLPWVVLSLAPISLTVLCSLAMKSLSAGGVLVRSRLLSVPATLSCGVLGAVLGGARGAAIGSLLGSCIAASIFYTSLVFLERARKGGVSNV